MTIQEYLHVYLSARGTSLKDISNLMSMLHGKSTYINVYFSWRNELSWVNKCTCTFEEGRSITDKGMIIILVRYTLYNVIFDKVRLGRTLPV